MDSWDRRGDSGGGCRGEGRRRQRGRALGVADLLEIRHLAQLGRQLKDDSLVDRGLVADAHMGAGRHRVAWNGRDDRGLPVSSGIYLYQVRTGDFSAVRKMIMLK